MNARPSVATTLFDALASLRLAVVVMVTLALTCLTATIYESKHGTPAAQRDFYQTWWFSLILASLGVNIFCAMMKRYPWKKHHTGFVLAHIGILTLLAGSLFSLHYGLDSNMPLYEGETSDRVSQLDKALQVALPGQSVPAVWPVVFERRPPGPGHEQRFRVPDTNVTLVAEDYQPHVKVLEDFEEGTTPNPALHFVLNNPFAKEDGWLLAADAERSQVNFGPMSVRFATAATEKDAHAALTAASSQNQIVFVLGPGDALRYGLLAAAGPAGSGPVTVGTPFETPWMGMKVTADRVVRNGIAHRSVAPETPPDKEERRVPAVKVRLESPEGRTESDWLLWTETRTMPLRTGIARVAYRSPELSLPFKVTLLKFNSDKYPGSQMAATYESWVRVDDPEQGVSEHHISMNHPMHYRGYIFFQASFVEGQPMMSIFSVARAPGLPLVYAGVILISAGVAWMFYLKPYLARRQAAQALAARRLQENRNEAQPSGSLPGRTDSAQPASGGY